MRKPILVIIAAIAVCTAVFILAVRAEAFAAFDTPQELCNWTADLAEAAAKERDAGTELVTHMSQTRGLNDTDLRIVAYGVIEFVHTAPHLPPSVEAGEVFVRCISLFRE